MGKIKYCLAFAYILSGIPTTVTFAEGIECPEGSRKQGQSDNIHREEWCETGFSKGRPVKHGKFQELYRNGKKKTEGSYQNDLKEGLWQTWYAHGEKESEGKYLSGQRNGQWRFWWPNGSRKREGSYKNDKQVGSWQEFSEKGVLVKKVMLPKSKRKLPIRWDSEGGLSSEGSSAALDERTREINE